MKLVKSTIEVSYEEVANFNIKIWSLKMCIHNFLQLDREGEEIEQDTSMILCLLVVVFERVDSI